MNRLVWHGDSAYRNLAGRAPAITGNIADVIAEKARSLAPVQTGELKRSIHSDGNSVIADADHAAVVELGSATRAAQPFMRPAIEQFNAEDLRKCI